MAAVRTPALFGQPLGDQTLYILPHLPLMQFLLHFRRLRFGQPFQLHKKLLVRALFHDRPPVRL
jgi:hypothetical protein